MTDSPAEASTPEASTATAVVALELAGYSVDVIIDDVDIVAHP